MNRIGFRQIADIIEEGTWIGEGTVLGISDSARDIEKLIENQVAEHTAQVAEMRQALEGIQALAPDKATHIHAICENILAKYQVTK